MKESPFELGPAGAKVRGFVQEPPDFSGSVVIILHGWIGYCAGPHRVLYELAESLAQKGIATVRFDFIGRGDSDGSFEETTFDVAVETTRNVAEFAAGRWGAANLCMAGMCFGASVGLRCCELWQKMALWSPLPLGERLSVGSRVRALQQRGGRPVPAAVLREQAWPTEKFRLRR